MGKSADEEVFITSAYLAEKEKNRKFEQEDKIRE